MKSDEFHKIVRRNGWGPIRTSGSHVIYEKGGRIYPVPYHKGREMPTGLLKKIIKEMGLK